MPKRPAEEPSADEHPVTGQELRQVMGELESARAHAEAELQAELGATRAELAATRETLAGCHDERAALLARVAEVSEERDETRRELDHQVAKATQAAEALARERAEHQQTRSAVDEARAALDGAGDQRAELQERIVGLDRVAAELREELEAAGSELARRDEELARHGEELAGAQERIAELERAQIQSAADLERRRSGDEDRGAELVGVFRHLEADLSERLDGLLVAERTVTESRLEHAAELAEEKASHEAELALRREALDAVQQEIDAAGVELETLRDRRHEAEARLGDLESRLRELLADAAVDDGVRPRYDLQEQPAPRVVRPLPVLEQRTDHELAKKARPAEGPKPDRGTPASRAQDDRPPAPPGRPRFGRLGRRRRRAGGAECTVCSLSLPADAGVEQRADWITGADSAICPGCQADGWRQPDGSSFPLRRRLLGTGEAR